MDLRSKGAFLCFSLSSFFKGAGKFIIQKEKQVVVDALTLPGWFVMDELLIHSTKKHDKFIKGIQWESFPMPDSWCRTMVKFKKREGANHEGRNKKSR